MGEWGSGGVEEWGSGGVGEGCDGGDIYRYTTIHASRPQRGVELPHEGGDAACAIKGRGYMENGH